ncbi:MAG: hypothetical protein FWF78_07820 [Defluviitaleaceae bacterium]|nr:hypothetical protein [Defluviitaleaceae bacterium]
MDEKTNEFIVEKIKKYNDKNDKEGKKLLLNVLMTSSVAISFVNIYIGTVDASDIHKMANEVLGTLFATSTIVGFSLIVSNILKKIGFYSRIDELESVIQTILANNEETKGIVK